MSRSITLAAIVVATAVVGAGAAVGWIAVASTDPESSWRDQLGTLGALSIISAFVAAVLGILAVSIVLAEGWRSRRGEVAVAGFTLGAITLGYWIWLGQHIG